MRRVFKTSGFRQLDRKMNKMIQSFDRAQNRQTEAEAAEIVLAEMEALVPVLSGRLRDSLGVVKAETSVLIGPVRGQGDWWRAHFVEFGTVNHPPDPFIIPAFDNTREEVTKSVGSTINAKIDRAKG